MTSRRVLKQLSSLELAIGELAAIAGFSVVGTLIKQNEPPEYYVQNFPGKSLKEVVRCDCSGVGHPRILSTTTAEGTLLDFHFIWALQWDQIYTANYFLALLALLSASLAACSVTRQWPMVKIARRYARVTPSCPGALYFFNSLREMPCRWRLAGSARRVAVSGSNENSVTLPDAEVSDLGKLLRNTGYAVFLKEGSLYAFKGLAGRLAPIGVHVSLLLTIAGEGPLASPLTSTSGCKRSC